MKRFTLVFLLFLLTGISFSFGQELRAELALSKFSSAENGPYLETYLRFKGESLKVAKTEAGMQATVIITYSISKAGNEIYKDAYKLNGPITEAGKMSSDFIDLQRIPVKSGKHEIVMTIKDANNPEGKEAKITQEAVFEDRAFKVFLSDFQLIDSYTKTSEDNIFSKVGYDLIPYTSNFYPETKDEISFYAEIYNTDRKFGGDGEFLINMFVESADDGRIIGELRKFSKHAGQAVVPVLHSFPLVDVESGNYNLVLEARDRKNEVLDRQTILFQRSNPIESDYVASDEVLQEDGTQNLDFTFVGKYNRPEELKEYLRCLHPISTEQEISDVNTRMNYNDPVMMKRYMYNFWKQRNSEDPEKAWTAYWKEVEKVNANYGTNIYKGYDTDRGRVYLQYGPPNTISPNYFEPNTYPYEIWHYYVLQDHISANQSNKKFVFANVELGSQNFNLIHSDAKNEVNNRRWNHDLHKRSSMSIDLDQEDTGGHYGGRSKDLFENPY
ncbi:MAG: GWxTD domain-containing protein [Flavobacteriales bacterium]